MDRTRIGGLSRGDDVARRELDRGLLHALLVARPRRQDLEHREIAVGLPPQEPRRRDLSVRHPSEQVGAAAAPARRELEDARAAGVAEQARRREELAERRLLTRALLPARAARIDAGPDPSEAAEHHVDTRREQARIRGRMARERPERE
jgi:hypothetical protein